MKQITFVLDSFELYKDYFFGDETFCYSYLDTEEAIINNVKSIWTYDIGHLSFDLTLNDYKIVIVHNNNFLNIYDGMSNAGGKEIRFGHNLRRLLIGGSFDTDLKLNIRRSHPSAQYILNEKEWVNNQPIEDRDEFMSDFINGRLRNYD